MGSPRHTVDLYLARGFLLTFAVVLAVIVTMLQSLDLMNYSDEVLAAEGAGAAQILRYIGWRAPQLADRFAPFVALLAGLITFARLGRSSEVTALRAAGMSPLRVIAPLCAAGGAIALIHFAAHELVVVEANARLEQWKAQAYAIDSPAEAQPISNIRMTTGALTVRADSMRAENGSWRLENLRAYEVGSSEGGFSSVLRASAAIHDGTGWRVENAQHFEAGDQRWSAGPADWPNGPAPETIVAAALNPDQASLPELFRATEAAQGLRGGSRLETALLHRFAAPAASLIMPLLAAIAGFGLHRSNMLAARIAAGLALGFGYFVLDNLMVVMGRLDAAPPLLAAFAAPLLFLGAGLAARR